MVAVLVRLAPHSVTSVSPLCQSHPAQLLWVFVDWLSSYAADALSFRLRLELFSTLRTSSGSERFFRLNHPTFLMMDSPSALILRLLAASMVAIAASYADTVLIDYTFDGVANDIGPAVQVVDNGIAAGTSNDSTGVISTGAGNHTLGFNSSAAVDLSSYAGFTATFVVDSITLTGNVADLLYNGYPCGMSLF